MRESLKRRRLELLWQGYSSVPEGRPFLLGGEIARRAYGGVDAAVHRIDLRLLRNEGAITPAHDLRLAQRPNVTPYWITEDGKNMLRDAGYPVDPPGQP